MRLIRIITSAFILFYSLTLSAQEPMWAGLYPADFNPIFPKEGRWVVTLHESPSTKSSKLGQITIVFKKGSGFSFVYTPSSGTNKKVPFKPDLYDSDWGYGPFFHQTVLSLKNGWALLPKVPLEEKAWANLTSVLGEYDLKTIVQGMIYKLDDRSIYIIKIDKNSISVRDEQEVDMWCKGGTPPPHKKFTPETIPFSDLYDSDEHLKLKVKYTRGC